MYCNSVILRIKHIITSNPVHQWHLYRNKIHPYFNVLHSSIDSDFIVQKIHISCLMSIKNYSRVYFQNSNDVLLLLDSFTTLGKHDRTIIFVWEPLLLIMILYPFVWSLSAIIQILTEQII